MKSKWLWFIVLPIGVMVWFVQKFVSHHAHKGHNWVHHHGHHENDKNNKNKRT